MIDAFDRTIGLELLRCFHLNDSKGTLGNRKDRHEHVGKGGIGLSGFAHILNDPRFAGVPMIIAINTQASTEGPRFFFGASVSGGFAMGVGPWMVCPPVYAVAAEGARWA